MPWTEVRKPFLALFFALWATLTIAVPDIGFPINSQLPPVAYVSHPYEFMFSASTFASNALSISYAIKDGPEWLKLNTSDRLLTGTPSQSDVGATSFHLTASDATGTASESVTLIVLGSTDLKLEASVLPQLQQAGPASAPGSLLLKPLQAFHLAFNADTFSSTTSTTSYYAVSEDHSPLPSWIQFDPALLLFSGRSPPLLSPSALPQAYGILLIASSVPGFAEVVVPFDIVVGQHVLTFSVLSQTIDITSHAPFETLPLRSALRLDGNVIGDDQISNIVADGPEWINLDSGRISLSGIPDASVNLSITISVTDIYDDVANTTVYLQANELAVISMGTIADVNITNGANFSYVINSIPFSSQGQVSANLGDTSSWLRFNASDRTLSGTPPLDLPAKIITVQLSFENATVNATGTVVLHPTSIPQMTLSGPTETKQTPTNPAVSQTNSRPNAAMTTKNPPRRAALAIILAITLSVLGVLLAICLLLCLIKRKRHKRAATNVESDRPRSIQANHNPTASSVTQLSSIHASEQPPTSQHRPPARPPRIDLAWSNDSLQQSRYRLSGIAPPKRERTSHLTQTTRELSGEQGASYRALKERDRQLDDRDVEKVESLQQASSSPAEENTPFRESSTPDRQETVQTTAEVLFRRSGAGHGAGILVHPDAAVDHRSWRDTWKANTLSEDRRTTVVLESFPNPPGDGSKRSRPFSTRKPTSPPPRLVSIDSNESLSFETRRQRWHTERARTRLEGAARFSNAASSQMADSAHKLWARRIRAGQGTGPGAAMEGGGPGSDCKPEERSWSNWSGIGPAAHESLRGRTSVDDVGGNTANRRTNASVASSGQFESVCSSDSQWEDENLMVEETKDGARRWQTDRSSTGSPRLPFDPFFANTMANQDKGVSNCGHVRVSDQRKHVSVEGGGLTKSQGSQRGSFRFI